MQFNVHVRRWVAWWFYVGIVCGGVALANILGRDLTRSQERILLLIGALHWLLGGVVCWAFDAVKFRSAPPQSIQKKNVPPAPETEWHPASDFLLPGRRRSLLPPSAAFSRHPRRSGANSLPTSSARHSH
jgi:hypothetical protein